MTDAGLAQLELQAYLGRLPLTYTQGVAWAAASLANATVVVLPGSRTMTDWVRDVMAFANPFEHGKLGPVHPGFCLGMEEVWAAVKAATSGPRVVIGHSLGASRAAILTALMVLDGQPPIRRVVWGEPKPGFQRLATIVASVPGTSYRNADGRHHDLITDCPFSFPPEEYVRAGHVVDVCQRPTVDHRLGLGIFAWHHMQLYAQAATT